MFFKERKAYKPRGRAPVPRKALRAASGEALLLPVPLIRDIVVIEIPQACVREKVCPVPAIAWAVRHHADRVPVHMHAVLIRFDHHRLARAVRERPVQRGNGSKKRHGDKRRLLLHETDDLLHRGALSQTM